MTTFAARADDLRPEAILAHFEAGRHDLAETLLLLRLIQAPNDAWSLTKLGIIHRVKKQYAAAEACYLRAFAHSTDNGHLHSNYGNLLVDMDRPDEGVTHTTRALELMPDDFVVRRNRAVSLREAKRFKEALEEYERCIENTPDDMRLRIDASEVALYDGQFDKAWDYFEARLQAGMVQMINPALVPLWQGEDIKGKRILVCSEQGFGDTILMARFLPLLVERGAEVTFGCKTVLHELFSALPCKLVAQGEYTPSDYDVQIPMMSLPRLLAKDWTNWPMAPKLHITDAARQKFGWLQKHAGKSLRVGILWSGSVTFANNEKRSVPYERFVDLIRAFPNVQFYSFQKGEREKDMADHGRGPMVPLGHMFDNFSETAAALAHMDLILMTDSALCHLAGATDVPVLDLLQYLPYWLYFPETPRSSVYDSVRYLRQETPGAWDPVFDKAKTALAALQSAKENDPDGFSTLAVLDTLLTPAKAKPAAKAVKSKGKK